MDKAQLKVLSEIEKAKWILDDAFTLASDEEMTDEIKERLDAAFLYLGMLEKDIFDLM